MIPALLRAYQLLQVAPWASRDQIRRAYAAKAKQYHPDLDGADTRGAEEMIALTDAREIVEARLQHVSAE